MTEPILPVPTYLYQDLGYAFLRAHANGAGDRMADLRPFAAARLADLAAQELDSYAACAGVFTMSGWFARWLIDVVGLPAEKVHAVGGGMNAVPVCRRRAELGHLPRRLLFVGKDFFRKGGDLVVDAVASLRGSGSGDYRLTVVGPTKWPLRSGPPDWVDFRGSLRPSAVGRLWADHNVFVLPSWFEAYGLTFLEARAAGLPCVGRRAFAMPELVPDGAGILVAEQGGAEAIAEGIHTVTSDNTLFERVGRAAQVVAQNSSWHCVAGRMLDVITPEIRVPSRGPQHARAALARADSRP